MKLRSRSCPLCGSNDDSIVVTEENFDESRLDGFAFASRKLPEFMSFRMVRCPVCDVLYASPAPESGWLRQGYESADFDAAEESRWAARTYARFLPRIAARLPTHSDVLDVGTGDGAFLAELRTAGFSGVVGIEPSRAPVAAAAPEVRSLIRESHFNPEDFIPGSIALLTCFQILEHVEDPGHLVGSAFRLLKPGGALFAVVHNYRAVSARVLGRRSPVFDIEHLQLHSPRSLRFLFETNGFRDISIGSLRNDYPLSYWVKLLPLGKELKCGLRRSLDHIGLGRLPVPLWAGNLWGIAFKSGGA